MEVVFLKPSVIIRKWLFKDVTKGDDSLSFDFILEAQKKIKENYMKI